MDKQALSDITVFNKYAKFLPQLGRRESYEEISHRNRDMHIRKYPMLEEKIRLVYKEFVDRKKVLPSMRSMQFGGRPIELCESRMFNCAYMPAEHYSFFSELMFLLLGGTGLGYSVQGRHISKLPSIKKPKTEGEYKFQIQDSIIGWADTIKVVVKAFFFGGHLPKFDYRDIRDKGEELVTTGGKAPGPEPLRVCVENITSILRNAIGRMLSALEVHDIACEIADSVRAGGIRRAAMIALFDRFDEEMLTCKSDIELEEWKIISEDTRMVFFKNAYGVGTVKALQQWEFDHLRATGKFIWATVYPTRARANNSAILLRGAVTEEEFTALMKKVEASNCGEPGIYWTNNLDWGTNPCVEIGLRPYQMCNLTESNASAITDQKSFNELASAAAFLGTLQAGYTDFHYLNPKWRHACEEDALLGVSMTGIASGTLAGLDQREAAMHAVQTNKETAALIGINPAARVTCVKPAGTTSLVFGTSSGIHAWHAPFYIRRQRAGKDEALAQYMMQAVPELVEEDVTDPRQIVISFPQRAPEGAVMRGEPMMELLSRVKDVSSNWVAGGHVYGENRHNVSCTISVKPDEWGDITNWMWENRDSYGGISVFPHFGSGTYQQAPFEDITEERYNELLPYLKKIDISQVFELTGENVNLVGELACAGGMCELTF